MRRREPEGLVARLVEGDAAAGRELLAAVGRAGDGAERAALLDPLALAAATSGRALEVLLTAVDRHRLAGPAIHALLVDPDDADDVSQDVLIAVSRSIDGYRGDARFTTWLSSVARNTTVAHLRRRREAVALDEAPLGAGARISSMIATRTALRGAIEALDPLYREPLLLRDVEHRSYQDVAEALDLPLNTVRSRIRRARALVAGALSPDEDLDGG